LIRPMSLANPLGGAPPIHGEPLKLGLELSQTPGATYRVRERKPPSPTWRSFLTNHAPPWVATDFFRVPTVTFRVLDAFVVLAQMRRRLLHFNVTQHPTAAWTPPHMLQAFPEDPAPRDWPQDRDQIDGESFRPRIRGMGVREVLTAPQSPWQNPYVAASAWTT